MLSFHGQMPFLLNRKTFTGSHRSFNHQHFTSKLLKEGTTLIPVMSVLKNQYQIVMSNVMMCAFQTAEKDEFEHKQKELEKVCMPIVTKLYQGAGGGGMPGGPAGFPGGFAGAAAGAGGASSGGGAKGPTIEEVD